MRLTIIALTMALAQAALAANTTPQYSQTEIKVLNDSVSALATSNPQLSAKLQTFTNKVSGQTQQQESQETPATQSADIQVLKDAADSLRSSHPDLAGNLDTFAAREAGSMNNASPTSPAPAP